MKFHIDTDADVSTLQEMQLIEIKHKNLIGQMQQSKPGIGDLGTTLLTSDPHITSVTLTLKTKMKMELDSLCERCIWKE